MLLDINPASNADWLLTIEGLGEIYWTQMSGLDIKFTRPKFNDGLAQSERTAATGKKTVSDVTMSKPYDPAIDGPVIAWLLIREDGSEFNATVRCVTRGKSMEFRGQNVIRLSKCRLMGYKIPGAIDTNGGDAVSMIEISFSVDLASFS